jgi:hypothetical protein
VAPVSCCKQAAGCVLPCCRFNLTAPSQLWKAVAFMWMLLHHAMQHANFLPL